MRAKYSAGWSDPRGTFTYRENIYRKEYQDMWTTVLPKQFRRYRIMTDDKTVAEQLTSDEADAMIKLLEASRE
jgi:hypothetical protein